MVGTAQEVWEMKCPICGAWDWTDGQAGFRWGHHRKDGRWCYGEDGSRLRQLTLKDLKDVFGFIDELRQELRERAEAHEEAVAMESETASELWELRKMVER